MKYRLSSVIVGLALLTGCQTTSIETQATPERIQAVTALASYVGGREIVKQGNREQLTQAVNALRTLQAAGMLDAAAVVAILNETDLKDKLDSTEGGLILGAALVFLDGYTGQTTTITDDARFRAALAGLIRGFDLALKAPAEPKRGLADTTEVQLKQVAVKTR